MERKFKKDLKQLDVWGLALGAIIGWGCFVLPGTAFLPKAGPIGSVLGLAAASCVIMIISLSYAYLIRRFPVSGGEFVYIKHAFGKRAAFVCGWFIILAYWSLIPLNATALAMISRYIFPGVIQVGRLYSVAGWDVYIGEIAAAYVFIIGIAFLNVRGVKSAGAFQTAVALTLVASILLATIGVFASRPSLNNLKPYFNPNASVISCVGAVAAYAPYCFIGFDCIPQAAEEYSFSHKKSMGIMLFAIAVAGALYSCVVLVTAVVRPWLPMLAENPFWATGEVIRSAMGELGVWLIAVAMFCAAVSGINAFYISTGRLMYSMARENALPAAFSKLDKKSGVPRAATLFCMALALAAPFFGRQALVWVVDMTSVGGAMAFLFTCAAAFKISVKEGLKFQPIASLLGVVFSAVFMALMLTPGMPGFLSPPSFVCLFAWIILGVGFYLSIRKKYAKGDEKL